MTISTEVRKAGPYIGNGVQVQFPFAFKVFKESDIKVMVVNAGGEHEQELILGRDYKVSLQSNQNATPGGNVLLMVPLMDNGRLVIISHVPYLQPTEITNQGAFYPSVLNNGLDRSTIQIQQVVEIQGRTLTYPATVTGFNPRLPLPEPDAALGYNDDCSSFKNIDIAGMKENNAQALALSSEAVVVAKDANTKSSQALDVANGVNEKAIQALSNSQSAVSQITTAVNKVNEAVTTVNGVADKASQAQKDAASALGKINQVTDAVEGNFANVLQEATNALNKANDAYAIGNNALNTANKASAEANNAIAYTNSKHCTVHVIQHFAQTISSHVDTLWLPRGVWAVTDGWRFDDVGRLVVPQTAIYIVIVNVYATGTINTSGGGASINRPGVAAHSPEGHDHRFRAYASDGNIRVNLEFTKASVTIKEANGVQHYQSSYATTSWLVEGDVIELWLKHWTGNDFHLEPSPACDLSIVRVA